MKAPRREIYGHCGHGHCSPCHCSFTNGPFCHVRRHRKSALRVNTHQHISTTWLSRARTIAHLYSPVSPRSPQNNREPAKETKLNAAELHQIREVNTKACWAALDHPACNGANPQTHRWTFLFTVMEVTIE